jgi:hypothetical protein
MTTAPTSALAELRASAATPDEKAFATISGRSHVQLSLAAGYYEWASVGDLERQLTRLARLLFVARMRAYYVARSRDFGQTFTKESPPTSSRDRQYVLARSGLVVEGEAAGGVVRVSAVGMDSWTVHLDRDVQNRLNEAAFCTAVSSAASQLVESQFAQVRALKREVYAGA